MKVASVVWVYKEDDDVFKWVKHANGAWGSIVMHDIDTSFENLYSFKVIIFI